MQALRNDDVMLHLDILLCTREASLDYQPLFGKGARAFLPNSDQTRGSGGGRAEREASCILIKTFIFVTNLQEFVNASF